MDAEGHDKVVTPGAILRGDMADEYQKQIDAGKKWVTDELHRQAKGAVCSWRDSPSHGVYLLTVKYDNRSLKERFIEEHLADCAGTEEVKDALKKQVSDIVRTFEYPELKYEKYLFVSERFAIKWFVKKVRVLLHNSLLEFRMFGSKITGASDLGSDIDVLLVIGSEDWHVRQNISRIAAEINMEYGCSISPVVYTRSEYIKNKEFNTFFIRQIEAQGVALV